MPEQSSDKSISFFRMLFKGSIIHNPVLVQVIGICPVIAAAVSLKAGALLAGVYTVILLLTQWIACAFLKNVPRWIRMAIYLLIGLIVVCPVLYVLDKYSFGIRIRVGIYLPLLAVNSLAVLRCEKFSVKNSLRLSFFDSIAASVGYSAVLMITGLVRELLGSGKLAGRPVHFLPAATGFLMPFGGFLILGFFAAMLKWIVRRFNPSYEKEMIFEVSKLTAADKNTAGMNSHMAPKIHFGRAKAVYSPELPAPDQEGSPEAEQAENTGENTPAAGEPLDEKEETPAEEPESGDLSGLDDIPSEDSDTSFDEELEPGQSLLAEDAQKDTDMTSIEKRLQELLDSLQQNESASQEDEEDED